MKSQRTLRLVRLWKPNGYGIFRVSQGDLATYYRFSEIPCEIGGRGWEVWRFGSPEPYFVRTSSNARDVTCDCIGFEHKRDCRHVAALLLFLKNGTISGGVQNFT